jgi:hypothetical protein
MNKISHNENSEKLISDIYNIQVVLDYLENNCGGKELPWRSSKGCPGYRRKIKKQVCCKYFSLLSLNKILLIMFLVKLCNSCI